MAIKLIGFGGGRNRVGFQGSTPSLPVGQGFPMTHASLHRKRKVVPRRAFLQAGVAGVVAWAFPSVVRAASALVLPVVSVDRRFSILYKGGRIGTHTVSYSSATGVTQIDTEIELLVKVAFFTVFAYSHRSSETWQKGRLTSLVSETVEQGETLRVEGAATPQGFRVVSKGGPFIASSATLTSNSLWTPSVLEQATVVDAQHGGIIGVSAHKVGAEQIQIAGREVWATRYTFITPYLAGSIWYDGSDLWVRGEFERDGARIQYLLDA
jgi:hypothetical protein